MIIEEQYNAAQAIVDKADENIEEIGLEPKDINSKISEVARQFFFEKEKEFIGV